MLPLHYTLRDLIFISFSLIVFTSCSHQSEKNLAIIKTLEESLANSNKLLTVSTSEILFSLNEKLNDISTHERAKIWLQRALKVESLSKELNHYVEKIKVELSQKAEENKNNGSEFLNQNKDRIYDSLVNYQKEILAVDDRIYTQFSKSLVLVSSSFNPAGKNGNDLFNTFFDNGNIHSSTAMLTKLQNNIKIIENKVIMFCHEQVGTTGGPCIFISAISVINSWLYSQGNK